MRSSVTRASLFGIQLHVHWSTWLMPVLVFAHALTTSTWQNGLLNVGVLLIFNLGLLLHELIHASTASLQRIRTRDIYLYPICATSRLACISERPRQEIWIALSGLISGLLFVGVIAGVLKWQAWSFEPDLLTSTPERFTFFNRLFWCQALFAIANFLPTFPFDAAYLFRSALALTASRLRATEVAATLGSLVALGLILTDLLWLHSVLLGALAVFVFVMSQYELALMNYFTDLQHPQMGDKGKQIGMVSLEQLIDPESRPHEPNFTGFTWNSRARIWIEWRNGEPVSASAVLGE